MADASFRILGIPGSLRRHSFNRGLLVAARQAAPPGVEIAIADLGAIPLYHGDVEVEGLPPAVRDLKVQIRGADAVLIATPEYNYSFPGVLKNAIDWVSRPPQENVLRAKAAALMGAGGRFGTARAQLALRQVLVFTETYVLPKPELYVPHAHESFDAEGRLTDPQVREQLASLITALVRWTRAVSEFGRGR